MPDRPSPVLIVSGGWSEPAAEVARIIRDAGVPLSESDAEAIIDPDLFRSPFHFARIEAACYKAPCQMLMLMERYLDRRRKSGRVGPIAIYHPWAAIGSATTGWSWRINPIVVSPASPAKLLPHERRYDAAMRERARINGKLIVIDPLDREDAINTVRAAAGLKKIRAKASRPDPAGVDHPADQGLASDLA